MTPLESAFQAITQRHPLLMADAYDTLQPERVLMLALLNVQCSAPAGAGTAFMQELCNWADAEQVTLAVFPCSLSKSFVGPDYKATTSTERLVQFYQRFGFSKPRGVIIMLRQPKK